MTIPETRRTEALAEIARRRTLAEVSLAPNGAQVWWAVQVLADAFMNHAQSDMTDAEIEADAQHIAANNPAHVLAVLDAAEATLERHSDERNGYMQQIDCRHDRLPWPCTDAAAVLDVYAPVEGEGTA